jgi:hypothetical protein
MLEGITHAETCLRVVLVGLGWKFWVNMQCAVIKDTGPGSIPGSTRCSEM